jgi:hypothetical protein
MTWTEPTGPEKRNGSRLTPEDHDRITTAAREHLTMCHRTEGRIDSITIEAARRVAMHAIGCSADDLREVERDAIASRVLTIRNEIEAQS